eukprot:TRINITY_DN7127_c0_g1_i1.p1 TRINITY_DN7127_c0_g1~~TRINITY_DN7127_c0_g1_i1.p1  ORF type:complete len:161 (+),score=37.58 TRINITY_DN7127_c0_g1_i1:132-614(+)
MELSDEILFKSVIDLLQQPDQIQLLNVIIRKNLREFDGLSESSASGISSSSSAIKSKKRRKSPIKTPKKFKPASSVGSTASSRRMSTTKRSMKSSSLSRSSPRQRKSLSSSRVSVKESKQIDRLMQPTASVVACHIDRFHSPDKRKDTLPLKRYSKMKYR